MTSLYPTAMKHMPGIPKGISKNRFDRKIMTTFVTIKVLNRGKKFYKFPCGMYCDDKSMDEQS